jgi:hypothetical protein
MVDLSMVAQAADAPPELIYMIMDHLHADPRSLAVCSTVCRAWLPPTRYHLFSTVRISPPTANGFLELLQSSNITFLPYIRRLEIDQIGYDRTSPSLWMSATALMPYLTPLVAVRSLQLRNIYRGQIGEASHTRVTIFASTLGNIKQLEVQKVDFKDSTHLINFLCDFRLLERLSLEVHLLDNEAPQYSGRRRISSTLRSLRLVIDAEGPGTDIFRWLSSHNPLPAIRDLELYSLMILELSAAGHFVRALRNNLHNLAISLFFYSSSTIPAGESPFL